MSCCSNHQGCVHTIGRGMGDLASWQQASNVLVALLLTLMPREQPGAGIEEEDDQLLGDL